MHKYHKIMARIATFATLTVPAWVNAQAPIELRENVLLPPEVQEASGLQAQDVRVTIARIINVFMGLLGIIAVVIVLIGGFMWMTSGGDEDKTKKARGLIFAGVVGLAIILSAFAIARFVIGSLLSATAG